MPQTVKTFAIRRQFDGWGFDDDLVFLFLRLGVSYGSLSVSCVLGFTDVPQNRDFLFGAGSSRPEREPVRRERGLWTPGPGPLCFPVLLDLSERRCLFTRLRRCLPQHPFTNPSLPNVNLLLFDGVTGKAQELRRRPVQGIYLSFLSNSYTPSVPPVP